MNTIFESNNDSDQLAIRMHLLKNIGQIPKDLEFQILQSDGDEASLKSIRWMFWAWFDKAFRENQDVIIKALRGAGYLVPNFQTLDFEIHSVAWSERIFKIFIAAVLYQ